LIFSTSSWHCSCRSKASEGAEGLSPLDESMIARLSGPDLLLFCGVCRFCNCSTKRALHQRRLISKGPQKKRLPRLCWGLLHCQRSRQEPSGWLKKQSATRESSPGAEHDYREENKMLFRSLLFRCVIRVVRPGLPLRSSGGRHNRPMQHPPRPSTRPRGSRQKNTPLFALSI
jgi:hypothetical protein